MRKIILGIVAAALLSSPAAAKMVEQRIGYEIDGKKFEGMLVYDDSV
ncbi:MAG: lipoprotein, partial [Deltaproteobacteria bacterium]|nr:lipoprotein [Deltaproteobacteria bacterium]